MKAERRPRSWFFQVRGQFHRHLKCREIHAPASSRWRDPDAQLLKGAAWAAVKDSVLTDLGLLEDPAELLAENAERLDRAYRVVRAGLAANTSVTIDDDGKIHVASVKAIEEPPSLIRG
ncbi:hypothetical protein [Nonomuraea sp. NPDC049158]|uniref:hypothetical protein n=1 Tax=Nonomuraea sp. NPDC049158 TaxID=3155649 RepID=UPI00340F328E